MNKYDKYINDDLMIKINKKRLETYKFYKYDYSLEGWFKQYQGFINGKIFYTTCNDEQIELGYFEKAELLKEAKIRHDLIRLENFLKLNLGIIKP